MDALFISQKYLKENSVITNNTDWEILLPTILMVQDIYLQSILGYPLYEDLKPKLDPNTLSGDEQTLVEDYIQKVVMYYTMLESSPVFKYRYMNKGVQVKSSDNSQSLSIEELKFLMDRWKNIAERYAQSLTDYLKYNTALFPKYTESTTFGIKPQKNNYTVPIYLGDGSDCDCTKEDNQLPLI